MRTNRILLSLAMAAFLLLAVTPGVAQGPYYPVGSISVDMTSVSAGVGASWGSGVLRFKGQRHLFKIDGLSVGSVGVLDHQRRRQCLQHDQYFSISRQLCGRRRGYHPGRRRGRPEDAEPERRRHQSVCRAGWGAVEHRAPGLHRQRFEIGKLPGRDGFQALLPRREGPKSPSSNLTRSQAKSLRAGELFHRQITGQGRVKSPRLSGMPVSWPRETSRWHTGAWSGASADNGRQGRSPPR